MKKYLSRFLCASTFFYISWCTNPATAQTNQWTWMKGNNLTNQVAVYGTRGVPSAANTPGARIRSTTWKDNSGTLWLFGGYGYASSSINYSYMNDLWKYDQSTGNWTWVMGSNVVSQPGTYGTIGVAAATNMPGARQSATGWVDNSGNLWLWGGYGYASTATDGFLNDLWKYNIATGIWTWMKGSNTVSLGGTYGTQGTAAAGNTPGSRYDNTSWKDNTGNLWIWGGFGYAVGTDRGLLNDLWKYDITANNWIWMKGTSVTAQAGIYGTMGASAVANTPGSRYGSLSWTDASGNFWLFGGNGSANTTATGYTSDLWKYTVATNNWTWVKGSNTNGQAGNYGTMEVAAATNAPGARQNSATWKDNAGNLWLQGGDGLATTAAANNLNDLWKYDMITGNWTWMKGSNQLEQVPVFGTPGVANANNLPGGRQSSKPWTDNDGNLWMFGGYGPGPDVYGGTSRGFSNELWKFTLNVVVLPLSITQFTAATQNNTARLTWTVAQEQNIASYTIQCSADGRSYTSIGTTSSLGNTTHSHTYSFTDSKPLAGPGYYRLKITETDGTTSYSQVRLLNFGGTTAIAIYPNPVKDKTTITGVEAGMTIRLINTTGQVVLIQKATGTAETIVVKKWAAGTYRVQVYSSTGMLFNTTHLVKE